MPLYMVHVHVESDVGDDAERKISRAMAQFGLGKTAETDDHVHVPLAPWLYFGECADDERVLSTRLRSMLHLATGLELTVLVVPADKFHVAHTQGSMLGIRHLDPHRGDVE